MNTQAVMTAYNEHERIKLSLSGYKKYELGNVTRLVSGESYGSYISHFSLPPEHIDESIRAEIQFFTDLGRSFEWKTYDSDTPADIGENLLRHGFTKGETESFMALDLNAIDSLSTVDKLSVINSQSKELGDVTKVSDLEGITDAMAVQQAIWGGDLSGQMTHLLDTTATRPEEISIYVVYEDGGRPVSSAWIIYNKNSPFAGIWGGSTLQEYRGRGYYQALLHKRIDDAKKRHKTPQKILGYRCL